MTNQMIFIILFTHTGIDTTSHLLKVNQTLVDLSDFDCVLCYRTLWKPVVTPCGHTYCLVSFVEILLN